MTVSFQTKLVMSVAAAATFGAVMLSDHDVAVAESAVGDKAEAAASIADAQGNMHIPPDYRTTYEFLGSWSVAGDDGKGAKQLHLVYASPGTIEGFRKTGHFQEGAVIVKEVYDAATKEMTTGTVSREDKLAGWFLMVRDTRNDHTGNKLWGDGWGWSWFDAGDPGKTTSTDYKTDCQSCHVPARSTEWIYTLGYPPLKP
jgi:Cytochrome P460